MQIASGTVIAGKYVLEAPVGQGGMGSVWRARHLKLQSEVAVKFMASGIAASAAARERFEREARASARIDYLHIVHVHDYGIEGDTPYIVMELLRGESLDERLKRLLRLPVGELVPIVAQVCKALRRAHDAGFIHRDLKPGNIFLVRSDDDDEIVKLLDFGIAKETEGAVGGSTKTGEFMGSPHYMSPEQIQDSSSIDPRSDLWSLGVILFRAITGILPFPGEQIGAVIGGVLMAPIPTPSSYVRGLPEGTDAFFQKALSRNRAARFQSAREMAEAFAVLAGANTLAGPGRRGSSAPWIQRDVLMGAANSSSPAGHRVNTPAAVPPPRASEPGSHAGSGQPALPPPTPPPTGAAPFQRQGKTIKMKPFQGPAPDPGPPKDPSEAHSYSAGTQSLSDGTQLIAGTLTASPSARETAGHWASGGPGQSFLAAVRAWPPKKKIAAGGGIAAVLLLLVVVALRSPSTTEGDSLAGASETAAIAPTSALPTTTQASPGTTATAAASPESAPLRDDLSNAPGVPTPSAPSSPTVWKPSGTTQKSEHPKPPPSKGLVIIRAIGGTCSKITINGVDYGSAPKDVPLSPGSFRVYCRTSMGSTRARDAQVSEGKSTTVIFTLP